MNTSNGEGYVGRSGGEPFPKGNEKNREQRAKGTDRQMNERGSKVNRNTESKGSDDTKQNVLSTYPEYHILFAWSKYHV